AGAGPLSRTPVRRIIPRRKSGDFLIDMERLPPGLQRASCFRAAGQQASRSYRSMTEGFGLTGSGFDARIPHPHLLQRPRPMLRATGETPVVNLSAGMWI